MQDVPQNLSGDMLDDDAYWVGAIEEDTINTFTSPGAGGFGGVHGFLPPPPRPSFLDHLADLDRLDITGGCDFCSWAGAEDAAMSAAAAADASQAVAGLGWFLTLAIVAILSAAAGAAIMVTFLHCRARLTGAPAPGMCALCLMRPGNRPPAPVPGQAVRAADHHHHHHHHHHHKDAVSGNTTGTAATPTWRTGWAWPWRRRAPPHHHHHPGPKAPAAENHYTLEDLAYSGGASDEALYAELDRPASYQYQNAPCGCGAAAAAAAAAAVAAAARCRETPSAPSSAYYSDLSAPDRTYEAVGAPPCLSLQVNPHWEAAAAAARRRQLAHQQLHRQFQQLQQIQMAPSAACDAGGAGSGGSGSVPSDYV